MSIEWFSLLVFRYPPPLKKHLLFAPFFVLCICRARGKKGVNGTRHKLQGSQCRSDHTQIYLICTLKQ